MQYILEGILRSLIRSINLLLVSLVPLGGSGKSLWLPRTVCFSLQETSLTVSYFFRMQHLEPWNITTLQQIIGKCGSLLKSLPHR